MILDKTKLFGDVELGTYLAVGGSVVQKITENSVKIICTHLWSKETGRVITREFAGHIVRYNPKHYVYTSDIASFLPYTR